MDLNATHRRVRIKSQNRISYGLKKNDTFWEYFVNLGVFLDDFLKSSKH